MNFKNEQCEKEFLEAPLKLQEIVLYFDGLCHDLGKEAIITRVLEHVEGSSGVHEAHRGIDCRDEFENKTTFTPEEVNYITTDINNRYPREDGKLVCIHHSFGGGPMHFHFQIPYNWLTPDEITKINKGE